MRLHEFIEPVACYYHGTTIANLKTLKVRPSNLVNDAVVFAAILPEIALAMSGHWTDDDFAFGHTVSATSKDIVMKPYTMREHKPGTFEKFFRQPFFLYSLPADYFEVHEALQDFEVISYTDVPVHAMIKVDDAMAYLEGSPALRLIFNK